MPGKPGKIQLPGQPFLLTSRGDETFEIFYHGLIIRASPQIVKNSRPKTGLLLF
jgi:hypothetical protein